MCVYVNARILLLLDVGLAKVLMYACTYVYIHSYVHMYVRTHIWSWTKES